MLDDYANALASQPRGRAVELLSQRLANGRRTTETLGGWVRALSRSMELHASELENMLRSHQVPEVELGTLSQPWQSAAEVALEQARAASALSRRLVTEVEKPIRRAAEPETEEAERAVAELDALAGGAQFEERSGPLISSVQHADLTRLGQLRDALTRLQTLHLDYLSSVTKSAERAIEDLLTFDPKDDVQSYVAQVVSGAAPLPQADGPGYGPGGPGSGSRTASAATAATTQRNNRMASRSSLRESASIISDNSDARKKSSLRSKVGTIFGRKKNRQSVVGPSGGASNGVAGRDRFDESASLHSRGTSDARYRGTGGPGASTAIGATATAGAAGVAGAAAASGYRPGQFSEASGSGSGSGSGYRPGQFSEGTDSNTAGRVSTQPPDFGLHRAPGEDLSNNAKILPASVPAPPPTRRQGAGATSDAGADRHDRTLPQGPPGHRGPAGGNSFDTILQPQPASRGQPPQQPQPATQHQYPEPGSTRAARAAYDEDSPFDYPEDSPFSPAADAPFSPADESPFRQPGTPQRQQGVNYGQAVTQPSSTGTQTRTTAPTPVGASSGGSAGSVPNSAPGNGLDQGSEDDLFPQAAPTFGGAPRSRQDVQSQLFANIPPARRESAAFDGTALSGGTFGDTPHKAATDEGLEQWHTPAQHFQSRFDGQSQAQGPQGQPPQPVFGAAAGTAGALGAAAGALGGVATSRAHAPADPFGPPSGASNGQGLPTHYEADASNASQLSLANASTTSVDGGRAGAGVGVGSGGLSRRDSARGRPLQRNITGELASGHPPLPQGAGLVSTVLETLNFTFQAGVLESSSVNGEINVAVNGPEPTRALLRVAGADRLSSFIPNAAYSTPSAVDRTQLEVDTANFGGSGHPVTLAKYVTSMPSLVPIVFTSVWRVDENLSRLMLTYSLADSYPLDSVVLHSFAVAVPVAGGTAQSAQSKPLATFSKEKQRITWRFQQPVEVKRGEVKRLLCQFATSGPAHEAPAGIEARFEIQGAPTAVRVDASANGTWEPLSTASTAVVSRYIVISAKPE